MTTGTWAPIDGSPPPEREATPRLSTSSKDLVAAIRELSLARDLDTVVDIVRTAARALTGADGATFVLRDADQCFYVDEDAIAPLWKGRRFPMSACISGWVMAHGQPTVIPNIELDERIPVDAYRPTFVRSLAMVPIRPRAPIGAIGNYWADHHTATVEEVALLQALADSTSVALENVQLAQQNRTLTTLQKQKEALSALVLHDLKNPTSTILLTSARRLRSPELPESERREWSRVRFSAEQVHRTALNLLDIAQAVEGTLTIRPTVLDLGSVIGEVVEMMGPQAEARGQRFQVELGVPVGVLRADADLVRRVLQNLVDNALRHGPAGSTIGLEARLQDGFAEVAVWDEGPGIAPSLRERVFEAYVRLEPDGDAAGTGLGLTFCRLATEAHGGSIRVEGHRPRGSRFCFRLPCTRP